MAEVYFYHLTRSGLDAVLRQLIERALVRRWRVVVRGGDVARLDWLDEKLWLEPDVGFLPHGRAGGPHDADQPVLLTSGDDLPDQTGCLMAIDGSEVGAAEVSRLERVCILFDGNDGAAVARARDQWRGLTAAGVPAQYWSEESGTWTKKAEAGRK